MIHHSAQELAALWFVLVGLTGMIMFPVEDEGPFS